MSRATQARNREALWLGHDRPGLRSPGRRGERKLLGGKTISEPSMVIEWDNAPDVVRQDAEFRTLAGMAKAANGDHRASLIAQMRRRWDVLVAPLAAPGAAADSSNIVPVGDDHG